MTECTSTKGEWSTPGHPRYCPSCKALMPTDNGPLRSDHAIRSVDAQRSAQAQMGDLDGRIWSFKKQDYNRRYYEKKRPELLAKMRERHAKKRAA